MTKVQKYLNTGMKIKSSLFVLGLNETGVQHKDNQVS